MPRAPSILPVLALVALAATGSAVTIHPDAGGDFRFLDQGRALVFTTAGSRELWIHELAAGTSHELSGGLPEDRKIDGRSFTMTPDGTRVLFVSSPREGGDPRSRDLYEVARDGSGLARVVDGFEDPGSLRLDAQLDDGFLLFCKASAGGGLDLFAYHFADRALVRLNAPGHAKARVEFVTRHPITGEVVYVGDDAVAGLRRLWQVDPRGEGRIELSRELPRDFVVVDRLPGPSTRPGDQDPVKITRQDGVLFAAMDPASGLGSLDPRHLYRSWSGGGPVDELFRTEQGEGTVEFWPVEALRQVVVRALTPASNHFAVDLGSLACHPLHAPAVGSQGTHDVLPNPADGRVYFFGDLADQEARSFLYSARFDGTDFRRHAFSIPYDERGVLSPVLDPTGTAILFRGYPSLPNTFELFAVATAGPMQKALSDLKDRQECRRFELVPGRTAAVYAQKNGLWYRDWTKDASIRLTEPLQSGFELRDFAPSPAGTHAAFVLSPPEKPTSLELVPLP